MNVDENKSVAKAAVQSMAGFILFKRQGENDNKEGWTIFRNHPLTNHITRQGLASSSLHQHTIWVIEHFCVEVKASD